MDEMVSADTPVAPVAAQERRRSSARSTLFSVLGEFVYREPTPVWTSALLYVLAGLGFSDQAARQAIARGASAGWIVGERRGRETRWTLTASTRAMFDAGAERVLAFGEREPAWDGRWLVLSVTVPHARRDVRGRLYGRLRWAGLGNPAPGLWVTPHTERAEEIAEALRELGLAEHAVTVVGELGAVGLSIEEIVARSWDLDAVAESYARLLSHFTTLAPAAGDPTLFALVSLSDALRRFPFVDPQLPRELHAGWIGREATQRLRALRDAWHGPAHARWREIAAGRDPAA